MIIYATSLTVRGQPSPRFSVGAWLPFRNCEMVYFADLWAYPAKKTCNFNLLTEYLLLFTNYLNHYLSVCGHTHSALTHM